MYNIIVARYISVEEVLECVAHLLVNDERNGPQHHPELTVADLPVPVLINGPDHLIDLISTDLKESYLIKKQK